MSFCEEGLDFTATRFDPVWTSAVTAQPGFEGLDLATLGGISVAAGVPAHIEIVHFVTQFTCTNGVTQCVYIVLDRSAKPRVLLDQLGHCMQLGAESHHGFPDLIIEAVDSDYIVRKRLYRFDGNAYFELETTEVGPLKMNG